MKYVKPVAYVQPKKKKFVPVWVSGMMEVDDDWSFVNMFIYQNVRTEDLQIPITMA